MVGLVEHAVGRRRGQEARLPQLARQRELTDVRVDAHPLLHQVQALLDGETWGIMYATPAQLERMAEAWEEWAASPAALFYYVNGEALVRVPLESATESGGAAGGLPAGWLLAGAHKSSATLEPFASLYHLLLLFEVLEGPVAQTAAEW